MLNEIIGWLNGWLWGSILIYLLLGTGIYFTIRLGFIQIRHFAHTFGIVKGSFKSDEAGISSFQALTTSLAARVGTGNLAGVATAIYLGGPGAVFWMWAIAILGMATAFAESTLAQVYKVKDDEGRYRGGPSYYMEKGLGKRWMGVLFSIFLIISFGLIFSAVQANSISHSMYEAFGISHILTGTLIVIFTALIIFGGVKSIARFAEVVVPVMAIAYLLVAIVVIFMNLDRLGEVFASIFGHAFGLREAGAGAMGAAIMNGVKRGLFSNEAGMGSAPNIAAAAVPYPPHPASQGYVQMLGVFVDTIVICTATASVILLSDAYQPGNELMGIQLTQVALEGHVGSWGSTFVAVAILFFAFTSIVANYSYAETNLVFLEHNHPAGLLIIRLMVLGMVMFGALTEVPLIWAMADVSMGCMALVNLVAMLMLGNVVIKVAKDYNDQLNKHKLPTFHRETFPELEGQIEPGVWDGERNAH